MCKPLSSAWDSEGKKDENNEVIWRLDIQAKEMCEIFSYLKYWGRKVKVCGIKFK